ncbi:MAG: DUF4445 domain-containing protein [Deltaproteobacteria bacterium]|nr:DUF4445 domain-containing protein [Deltaproteobacteria bacterium]
MSFDVVFEPSGRRGRIESGQTILAAALRLGLEIQATCGQQHTCGKCRVTVREGFFEKYGIESRLEHAAPPDTVESGLIDRDATPADRLSCCTEITGDVVVFVPEESRADQQVVRKSARAIRVTIDPAVRKYTVDLPRPSLIDACGDFERLAAALRRSYGLDDITIDIDVLRALSAVLRAADWRVTVSVWMNREVILVEPGLVESCYGLAVDIGTTTVVGFLCDLRSGRVVATTSTLNPQVVYGEDVLSRLTYARTNPDGLERLRRCILEGLNGIIAGVAKDARIAPREILETVIVGNTVMHHLFLGIRPDEVGLSPYPPAVQRAIDLKGRESGLDMLASGNVHVLPLQAGFVGADSVAVLLAEHPYAYDYVTLIIDIGTNGELILGNRERLLSCSCATGPAFEGASVKFGMRAAPGAIEKVNIDPITREVQWKAIGDRSWHRKPHAAGGARGICGSGIIDAVAEMYRAGVLERSGAFHQGLATPRLRRGADGKLEFVLAWASETAVATDIAVTADDVRAVQLAKGAMYAGAKLMLERLGIERPDKIVLAGAFGSFMDKTKAMSLGMFPDCDLRNVHSVGNAAGDGARMALLSAPKRREAEEMARRVEYVELSAESGFQRAFARAMHLPHMVDGFPHLRKYLGARPPDPVPKQRAAF